MVKLKLQKVNGRDTIVIKTGENEIRILGRTSVRPEVQAEYDKLFKALGGATSSYKKTQLGSAYERVLKANSQREPEY